MIRPTHRTPQPRPTRAAVLVVHGVGEQAPYAPLDRVVRGLRTVLGTRVDQLTPTTSVMDGRVMSGVRFHLNTPLRRSAATELDVFEGYWAPMAKGLISARGVLVVLAQTLLTPFRSWSRLRLDNVSLGRRLELIIGEVVAAMVFTALLVTEIAIALWFVENVRANPFADVDLPVVAIVEIGAIFVAAGFLSLGVRGTFGPLLGALGRRWHRWYVQRVLGEAVTFDDIGLQADGADPESTRTWNEAAWLAVLPAAFVVFLIERRAWPIGRSEDAPIEAVTDFGRSLWTGLALLAIATVIGRLLSSVAGDVALYVADDADTTAGQFRTHILESVQGQLRTLLEDDGYDSVHIVSHSLGTIISYDALNRLRLEVEHRAATGCGGNGTGGPGGTDDLLTQQAFDRMGTLVTVACPLDHIDYFFRSTGSDSAPVQQQLRGRRRALRAKHPLEDAGRFTLDEDFATGIRRGYYPMEPADFAWLNIKATPDRIGTRLLAYRPTENALIRFGPFGLTAHVRVMGDRRTYERMLPYL